MAKPQDCNKRDCKVLSIVWYKVLPARFGGQKAVATFNEHLASFVQLRCLCSKNNDKATVNYQIENTLPVAKSQFINPLVWRKVFRYAKQHAFTHLILEFPYHGIVGVLCQKFLGVSLILNAHNLEHLRFKEMGKWWWRFLLYYERWVMQQCDLVIFKTNADKEQARAAFQLQDKKLEVIPYCAERNPMPEIDAKKIIRHRHSIGTTAKILLFAGTLDYLPNAQAVTAIEKRLLPLLRQFAFDFKILICGRNHLPEFSYLKSINNPSIIFAGEVDDINTYFAAADVFINPVTTGGGIQTKIVDALSHHLSVVAFESRSQEVLNAGEKLYQVADGNWNNFANAVFQAASKTTKTPAAFFETYNWRSIAAEAYQKICSV